MLAYWQNPVVRLSACPSASYATMHSGSQD